MGKVHKGNSNAKGKKTEFSLVRVKSTWKSKLGKKINKDAVDCVSAAKMLGKTGILLLVHLLLPTSKGHKKNAKTAHVKLWTMLSDMCSILSKMGASVEAFLFVVEPGQPLLHVHVDEN